MSKGLVLIGRLTKQNYMYNNELVSRCKFSLLKRLSRGSLQDLICDDQYDIPHLNMHNMKEGVYELKTVNMSKDYETGVIDDWDIRLVEYEKY